jgi:sugar phosphate isomerase/epimerase
LLGLSLDLAQLALQGEPYQAAMLSCADRIWTVHVSDAKPPHAYRLRPGLGEVPIEGMLEALRAIGYAGPFTLQLENYVDTPDQAAQEALEYLSQALNGCLRLAS